MMLTFKGWQTTMRGVKMRDEIEFLLPEQVIELHDILLRRYGGSFIAGHRGVEEGVAAAVFAVENSYYDDLYDLAAAYAVYIVMGHVFGDGNKRAASAASLSFLYANGIRLRTGVMEVCNLMIDVQRLVESGETQDTGRIVSFVADWFRRYTI